MTPEPVWVDLGLPSGNLWARANLGATVPESYGIYFSWGSHEGHPAGAGYNFNIQTYEASAAASISADLTLSDDVANIMLGGNAQIPSEADYIELIDNCDHTWLTRNGVSGLLFTSRSNGRSIFIPAAGSYNGQELNYRNVGGFYWTKNYVSSNLAYRFNFSSSSISTDSQISRYLGFAIRPILPV